MSYSIPIQEQDFLKTMTVANTSESDQKKDKKKLYDELEKINGESDSQLFEKIEYTPMKDNEIENLASSYAEENYQKKLQDYLEEYSTEKTQKSDNVNQLETKSEEDKSKVENLYESSNKEAENQALKRGLGRSSVIMNILKGNESEKNSKIAGIESTLSENLSEINKELANLESEKNKTINNMDFTKSLEIAEKIAELKEERDEKIQEITKFNNEVTEKQIKYKDEVKTESKTDTNETASLKINTIINFYKNYEPTKALKDFSEDEKFKEYLGDYYSEVYQFLKAKANNNK